MGIKERGKEGEQIPASPVKSSESDPGLFLSAFLCLGVQLFSFTEYFVYPSHGSVWSGMDSSGPHAHHTTCFGGVALAHHACSHPSWCRSCERRMFEVTVEKALILSWPLSCSLEQLKHRTSDHGRSWRCWCFRVSCTALEPQAIMAHLSVPVSGEQTFVLTVFCMFNWLENC